MQLTSLQTVQHRIQVGQPLPFNVRLADQALLLARGQAIANPEQLRALLDRGAFVDIEELLTPAELLRRLPREALPQQWQLSLQQMAQVLVATPGTSFRAALEEASGPVLALIERDPDLAIFQVLRREGGERCAYGVQRSMNSAITAFLVAQRLAWEPQAVERAFKVALTMNLSMLELQGQLSQQRSPLTPEQLAELQTHPMRSVDLLEHAGVQDRDWLQAVARHHEQEDGQGYPSGCTDVGDLASLARRADVYTAKLAARSHRDALSADVAGRQMFMQDPGHPMTAALVKEFGVYPPGCCVRLASGATGVVVQRGAMVTTPVVACLTAPNGASLPTPVRVDTAQKQHAVVGVVGERTVNAQITADKLLALTGR
ncbi:MAG: HD-GYP domain-containing protein [Rubrivivax sp.]